MRRTRPVASFILKMNENRFNTNFAHVYKLLTILVVFVSLICPKDSQAEFQRGALEKLDQAINKAIEEKKAPGGVLWLESNGIVYSKAYGNMANLPEPKPAAINTIYDAASLTKPIVTTSAILKLVEEEKLKIDAPVSNYLPEFSKIAGSKISIRHLLTHTSGLRPGLSLSTDWAGEEDAYRLICSEKLKAQPGERFIYSDINFILLGILVHKVSGTSLDQYIQEHVFNPLGMKDSGFNPPRSLLSRIAPTQHTKTGMLHGVVHDPTSRRIGGVAGHAGLFISAQDLAKFSRMILNEGSYKGVKIFKPQTIASLKTVHTRGRLDNYRSLGWDVDTGYTRLRGQLFSLGGIGHTGFTGPSIWIDFASKSFVFFLTNSVHPDGSGNVLDLREDIGTLAASALPEKIKPTSQFFPNKVKTGLDVLVMQNFKPLHGKRVGLITNHTGHDANRISTIEHFLKSPNVDLAALFSPEHGIRGDLDSKINDQKDKKSKLNVFSLYGETRKPLPSQLAGLDVLVFDIQDIGTRFYTYISTMGLAMEAAAENDLEFLILDRPNPIGGVSYSGPLLEGKTDFVGFHKIPIRHGMTVGELGLLFRSEREELKILNLDVIKCQGWQRGMMWSETGLPWTNPSPNMRSSTQALLYPGVGAIEFADISVGRGTDTPFEIIGAPYIHDLELSRELNRLKISGLTTEPITFTPSASKFKGDLCKGVRFVITDRNKVDLSALGLALTSTIYRLYPDQFDLAKVNRLLKSDSIISLIRSGDSLQTLIDISKKSILPFDTLRNKHLLYQ